MALLKFLKGNYSGLSTAAIAEGQVLICGDTGEMFVDVAADKRVKIGDFITVANITALEALDATSVPTSRLYYVEDGNILARSNGTKWIQVNKQPTSEELKGLLGLGSMAYVSTVTEANLDIALKEKVNAAAEGNHSHSNRALLDTYTQTEENLADAVAKKHEHTNKTELDKIVAGDKAKWDAVVADHLTSADKTALEDSIGDVNTALGEEVTRAKAAEKANTDAITAIKDGTTIDSFADVETALSGKVDKVEGKSLIADSEITRLADVTNYDDTKVKEDIAKKADSATVETELGKKVDKVTGYSLVSDTEIARLADVDNYDDAEVRGLIGDNADAIAAINNAETGILKQAKDYADGKDEAISTAKSAADKAQEEVDALETYVGTIPLDEKYADITNVISYVNKKAEETLAAAQGGSSETAASVKQQLDNYKSENDTRVKAAEDAIDAIEADYLKTADKTALQNQITANASAIELLTNGVSAEEVDGVNDLIQYVKDHGTEVTGMKADISANTKAIGDHEALAAETYETKTDATTKKTEIDGRLATLEGKVDVDKVSTAISTAVEAETNRATGVENGLAGRIKDLEDNKAGYATTGQVATAKQEAIDAAATDAQGKVDALANGQVKTNTEAIATNAGAITTLEGKVYTKTEVEALIEQAHTWGSF